MEKPAFDAQNHRASGNSAARSTRATQFQSSLSGAARIALGRSTAGGRQAVAGASRSRSMKAAGETRTLDIQPDLPDLRDRTYEPTLQLLEPRKLLDLSGFTVLDQGQEGACTGFSLAHIVNLQNARRSRRLAALKSPLVLPAQVSPRMLYEMARLHDEWAGEDYDGSSIRGALKGLFNNGVCDARLAPYKAGEKNWTLTVEQAKDARTTGLGAYFRLKPDIVDYHAALAEVDAIYVSARVHKGWSAPKGGRIVFDRTNTGGHAFVIVGYDESGFYVLNSWGAKWGGGGSLGLPGGVAHWSYEDWGENIMDAWVLQLSVPAPTAFDVARSRTTLARPASGAWLKDLKKAPRRQEVVGHIFNVDDGKLQDTGAYATPLASLQETGQRIRDQAASGASDYKHIMLYAHGGLNSIEAGAMRAAILSQPLKKRGVYSLFALWGTGFFEEFGDLFKGLAQKTEERVGGIDDIFDRAFEALSSKLGRAVWNQMKADAALCFTPGGGGSQALGALLNPMSGMGANRPRLHLVGHSAGAIFSAHLLARWPKLFPGLQFETMHLFAPACRVDLYEKLIAPAVGAGKPVKKAFVYNLDEQTELDDTVGTESFTAYRKSLLYLVSNAFEDERGTPLLGMEAFKGSWTPGKDVSTAWSPGAKESDATTHGGFDNDPATMNTMLERMLGAPLPPALRLRKEELEGY